MTKEMAAETYTLEESSLTIFLRKFAFDDSFLSEKANIFRSLSREKNSLREFEPIISDLLPHYLGYSTAGSSDNKWKGI